MDERKSVATFTFNAASFSNCVSLREFRTPPSQGNRYPGLSEIMKYVKVAWQNAFLFVKSVSNIARCLKNKNVQ